MVFDSRTDSTTQQFSQYIVYKPEHGDALVMSGRSTIYRLPNEAFYAAVDAYLVQATWVTGMSWENNTRAVQSCAHSYTTQFTVTNGAEVTNAVDLGAAFKGLTISLGRSRKTFSSTETTTSQTTTTTINIPATTKVTFYQRMYEFRTSMFFILYAWGEEWNAGSPGGYIITRKEATVQIMSEDYITSESELESAIGSMTVATVPRQNNESYQSTRKRENLTQPAKDALSKMGV